MVNKGYVLVEEIIEGVYQDMGVQTIQWDNALRWVGRVLGILGISNFYMNKSTNGNGGNLPPIKIENYRGELPGDFVSAIVAREFIHKIPMYINTGIFEDFYNNIDGYLTYMNNPINMQLDPIIDVTYDNIENSTSWSNIKSEWFNELNWYSSYKPVYDTFNSQHEAQLNYKLEGGFIQTNFKEGLVELAYKAFPVDKDFRPLIPNDEKIKRAVETFIMERLAFRRYTTEVSNQNNSLWQNLKTEYLFAVASARSHANAPDMEQMESISNSWLRLIPDIRAYEAHHKFNNIEEKRRH